MKTNRKNDTNLRKREILKGIVKDLHSGADTKEIKERFKELISDINPSEISVLEEELIEEGMPESEIKRLCDVHVAIFKESLEKQRRPQTKPGHPIHTFMEENREAEKILQKTQKIMPNITESLIPELHSLIDRLKDINLHYLRKENQLFPLLESYGVSGPTQVMWQIHDDIRASLKEMEQYISDKNLQEIETAFHQLNQLITDMIYKEEHILFPMSLETLSEGDWVKVRNGEEEIGYAWVTPGDDWHPDPILKDENYNISKLLLDTGSLSLQQLNLMLKHLPVDVSFVDVNDEVAYYSDTAERIFPRSAGVIGRKVQKCHPPKSVHIVEKIVQAFKDGTKDVAEFWIQLNGKFIHIRYFAVRDENSKYKGTLEVSQDITDIKKLKGERRLLDWD